MECDFFPQNNCILPTFPGFGEMGFGESGRHRNQPPFSFHQPHSVHCPPGSPHPAHITSSQSPSLSSPITASTFHSRLKTHLFHESFPPYLNASGLPPRILILYWTELSGHWHLFVLVSSFSYFFSGYVCWSLSFWVHVKLLFSHRIVRFSTLC